MKIELEVTVKYGVGYGNCGEGYTVIRFYAKKKEALELFNSSKEKIRTNDTYKDCFVDLFQNGKCISTYSRGL